MAISYIRINNEESESLSMCEDQTDYYDSYDDRNLYSDNSYSKEDEIAAKAERERIERREKIWKDIWQIVKFLIVCALIAIAATYGWMGLFFVLISCTIVFMGLAIIGGVFGLIMMAG